MTGYEILNIGVPGEWRNHFGGFRPESSRDGRRVVDHEMHMQYIGMTANSLIAGEEAGYWHKHSQVEELYIFLAGRGQLGLNDDLVEVSAGDVVRLSPENWITWRCHPEEPNQLQWICIRAGATELPDFPNDATKDPERKMPWA
jgi:mannose-6-phosphate isomerase-like protein (cupin superfamily)